MAVPDGLARCPTCGETRGVTRIVDEYGSEPVTVSCLCDGVVCTRCRKERRHRPISNYYDEKSGKVLHAPHFTGWRTCSECGQSGGWELWSPGSESRGV